MENRTKPNALHKDLLKLLAKVNRLVTLEMVGSKNVKLKIGLLRTIQLDARDIIYAHLAHLKVDEFGKEVEAIDENNDR